MPKLFTGTMQTTHGDYVGTFIEYNEYVSLEARLGLLERLANEKVNTGNCIDVERERNDISIFRKQCEHYGITF